MPSLRLTSLAFCGLAAGLASASGPAWAGGTVRHYDIDVEIAASTSTLRATAALTIQASEGGLQQIELLLNHGLAVRSLTSDVGVKSLRFDRSEPSTNRYAPRAAPLRIELAEPVAAGRDVVVRLSYEGTIDPDPYLTNVLTPEWVELASYAAWYPQQPGSSGYTYRLGVKADPGYAVAGPGVLAAAKDGWTLTQDDQRYEHEAQQAKPIWGLDRSDRTAQATLYRKGPVLLSHLEARLGEPAFRQLLAVLVSRQVRTTEQYLATLEELTSAALRQSFEQELKG